MPLRKVAKTLGMKFLSAKKKPEIYYPDADKEPEWFNTDNFKKIRHREGDAEKIWAFYAAILLTFYQGLYNAFDLY